MKEREVSARSALKLALEALEYKPIGATSSEKDLNDQAITAIKDVLEAHKALANHIPDAENMVAQSSVSVEQEFVEDLQAKLRWAKEQLDANINWEFVASAKEEMLKAAWAEIKELREQTKELREQEPVAWAKAGADWLLGLPDTPLEYPYFTNGVFKADCQELAELLQSIATPPTQCNCSQRSEASKPLTDEEIQIMWQNTSPYYDHQDFARAIEAAHGIT